MSLIVEQASKAYGHHRVLDQLNLSVNDGICLGLLGASGSGKTTLLRALAGLERLDSGQIKWRDAVWSSGRRNLPPHSRHLSLVFQDLALWPHLTVRQHLTLVAGSGSLSRSEQAAAVARWLDRLQLTRHSGKRPDQISGGEQQRLALARALISLPQVILLDEPFGGCDRSLVDEMKGLVSSLHRELSLTTLIVSHDWRDMEGLVDEIAILDGGRIVLQGAPDRIREGETPAFVQRFFG